MNQTLEYLLIFGAVGVLFVGLYAAATDDVGRHQQSMQDRYEAYKARMQERIVLVDAPTADPVGLEVVNVGSPVVITDVFVNGTSVGAGGFAIYDADGILIPNTDTIGSGVLIQINTTASHLPPAVGTNQSGGVPVAVMTGAGSVFRFG